MVLAAIATLAVLSGRVYNALAQAPLAAAPAAALDDYDVCLEQEVNAKEALEVRCSPQ